MSATKCTKRCLPRKTSRKVHFASLMHSTVLLHARDPRRGLVVVAASDAAASAGVRIGMPLAEAMTLVRHVVGTLRVPSPPNGTRCVPTTLPHDPAADLAELARLAEHCERFSPLVGWETVEIKERSEVRGPRSEVCNLELGTWNLELAVFRHYRHRGFVRRGRSTRSRGGHRSGPSGRRRAGRRGRHDRRGVGTGAIAELGGRSRRAATRGRGSGTQGVPGVQGSGGNGCRFRTWVTNLVQDMGGA